MAYGEEHIVSRSSRSSSDDDDRSVFSELTDPLSDQDAIAKANRSNHNKKGGVPRPAAPRVVGRVPMAVSSASSPNNRRVSKQTSDPLSVSDHMHRTRPIVVPQQKQQQEQQQQQQQPPHRQLAHHRSVSNSSLVARKNKNNGNTGGGADGAAHYGYESMTGESYKRYSSRSLLHLCGSGAQRRFSMGNSSRGSASQQIYGSGGGAGGCGGGGGDGEMDNDDDDDDDSNNVACEEPQFEIIMAIVSSWEGVKTVDGYEEKLSEQILLRMMELDSHVRKDLGLLSIRSHHFHAVSDKIISVIDGLLSFLGPDLEDFYDQIADLGDKYRADGFKEYLLVPALVDALKYVVPEEDFSPHIQKDWTTVMNFLVSKMSN
ncbi:hypothetical protein ACA910_015855 [Epithemia clementina (nom. ined.)]